MTSIDLNVDVGEGIGDDRELIALATSASIACGAHAGDATTMNAAVRAAVEHGVVIGAHPGHADRDNFGRVESHLSINQTHRLVTEQLDRLAEVASKHNAGVRYVKLHGALYHQAGRDAVIAEGVVEAVACHAGPLAILGQPGSALHRLSQAASVAYYCESFADRAYSPDGALAPRSTPGAVLDDESRVVDQALGLVLRSEASDANGSRIAVASDSLCLHGDTPRAARLAAAVRQALVEAGVTLRPFRG